MGSGEATALGPDDWFAAESARRVACGQSSAGWGRKSEGCRGSRGFLLTVPAGAAATRRRRSRRRGRNPNQRRFRRSTASSMYREQKSADEARREDRGEKPALRGSWLANRVADARARGQKQASKGASPSSSSCHVQLDSALRRLQPPRHPVQRSLARAGGGPQRLLHRQPPRALRGSRSRWCWP